tara:strand:- start:659 stop:1474 length:816 start_codon:yes stop_codon:yes gene_type:complete
MIKRREDGFPRIMGVVNATPDSFHPGSRCNSTTEAVNRAVKMANDGADWIDVGGESTRPGAKPVPIENELARVLPVIRGIRDELPEVCISVDTRRSEVARQCLEEGAEMVNDVSSLGDEAMLGIVSDFGCPVCLMHMQGLPENMQDDPRYGDVVTEVRDFFADATEKMFDSGVEPNQVIVDPGIGFGKRLEHNLALLSSGREIVPDERMGLMWGVSRKSMIGELLGRSNSEDRLYGTLGVGAKAFEKGVDIVRVHDVVEHADMFSAMSSVR